MAGPESRAGLPLRRRLIAMRVGFLVAGDNIHHVAHVVPIAVKLAASRPGSLVYILSTGKGAAEEIERRLPAGTEGPIHLRLAGDQRIGLRGSDPGAVLRGADVLPSLDGVVVTSLDHAHYGARYRSSGQKIVYLWAGAKDHAPADGPWDAFDHILVAGEKSRTWLSHRAGVDANRVSVVGCPKFDDPAPNVTLPFARDGRRVILYNPHHSPDLSSWYRWGRTILDWFVEHDDHQLIFAPHVKLFAKRFARSKRRLLPRKVGHIEERHLRAPNIHIDLGSSLSTARAYTEQADLYIGDAGGQLYEFIARPRPCAFLNVHGVRAHADDPGFFNWQAGHVIDDAGALETALDTAILWHPDVYRPVQQDMFAHSISTIDRPASERAAAAIDAIIAA